MPDQISIRIHHQKRRGMAMKRTPVGLVVFLPKWMRSDSPQAQAFIAEGIHKLGAPPPREETLTAGDLRRMVNVWAQVLNVQPARVQIRTMYRKWGSCSSKGTICLNSALCSVPEELAEYVVVHELVHLTHFNHGREFKAAMTRALPDWRERELALTALLDGRVD
ncbi:MAG: M48 family metallopeptidase [Anaerolineae bacterium]|nr:M48 family metallopeptidase [Anaerolineae bacterium]